MRTYERNGVTVDQCNDCRGVYLDRGELDRLIDAEASTVAPVPPRGDRDFDDEYRRERDRSWEAYGGHGGHGGHKPKRRGFLSEIFDD